MREVVIRVWTRLHLDRMEATWFFFQPLPKAPKFEMNKSNKMSRMASTHYFSFGLTLTLNDLGLKCKFLTRLKSCSLKMFRLGRSNITLNLYFSLKYGYYFWKKRQEDKIWGCIFFDFIKMSYLVSKSLQDFRARPM